MSKKTNLGLVEYAKVQLGHPYWYGCFGQVSNRALYNAKKRQYPVQYQWACKDNQLFTKPKKQLGVRVYDCVGLIKAYLWCDTPTSAPDYKGSQDVSANGMLSVCKERGSISSFPYIKGTLVFMPGHVGVYIGDGYVIEAKGHRYGVVKTKFAGRGWKNWGKCPWIEYIKEEEKEDGKPTFKVGSTYELIENRAIRKGAGLSKDYKKLSELTEDGKLHSFSKNGHAVMKKGTRVTVKATKTMPKGSIWVKIPSGYFCAYSGTKKKSYIK